MIWSTTTAKRATARRRPMLNWPKRVREIADIANRPADARDLKIEYVSVSDLVPYARNARTHSEQQVKVIAESIKRFGWTNPVLIGNNNDIIAGHGRVLAAKRLGLKMVPV